MKLDMKKNKNDYKNDNNDSNDIGDISSRKNSYKDMNDIHDDYIITKKDDISISILKIKKKNLTIDFDDNIKSSEFSNKFVELVLKVPIDCVEKALVRRNAIKAGTIFVYTYVCICVCDIYICIWI
jgi:hypothetical protein